MTFFLTQNEINLFSGIYLNPQIQMKISPLNALPLRNHGFKLMAIIVIVILMTGGSFFPQ